MSTLNFDSITCNAQIHNKQENESDLILHDDAYVPRAFGMKNLGATCFFNACMQALLSCSAFNAEIARINKIKTPETSNPFIDKLCQIVGIFTSIRANPCLSCAESNYYLLQGMLKPGETTETLYTNIAAGLWPALVRTIATTNESQISEFINGGQQCSREAFSMVLKAFEKWPRIARLFTHRYQLTLYCPKCEQTMPSTSLENTEFVVPLNYNAQAASAVTPESNSTAPSTLREFILRQYSSIDRDHVCQKCGEKGGKMSVYKLEMLPEILVVVFKKYAADTRGGLHSVPANLPFPQELKFTGVDGGALEYKQVAQIEHSGGLEGGHYWAVALRDRDVVTFNDTSVSSGVFGPTPITHMVFYTLFSQT